MILLAAVALGATILSLMIPTAALMSGSITWALLGNLISIVISGLITFYAARAGARFTGRAFAVLPGLYGGLPSGAVEPQGPAIRR